MTADKSAASWRRVRSGTLIPYDHAWRQDTFAAERATLTWGYQNVQVQAIDLDAAVAGSLPWQTVGWEKGDYELRLMFDEAPAWTALLSLLPDSTLMLVR